MSGSEDLKAVISAAYSASVISRLVPQAAYPTSWVMRVPPKGVRALFLSQNKKNSESVHPQPTPHSPSGPGAAALTHEARPRT